MTHKRDGFTLIELLVAVVISGVLAGVIFQVLQGQGNFARLQSAREDVQQNTRGGLELLTSDLRAVPPGGLRAAATEAVGIRSPVVWGVVCADPSATGTTLDVAVPVQGVAYDSIDMKWSRLAADVGPSPASSNWSDYVRVSKVEVPSTTACATLPAGVEVRRFTVDAMPTGKTSPNPAPVRGSRIYLATWTQYQVGSIPGPNGTTERWLMRVRGDGGTPQQIAGPLPDAAVGIPSPLQFAYFTAASATPLPTPINDDATLDAVSRIQVVVGTQSRRKVGSQHQLQFDTATVFLRNRS